MFEGLTANQCIFLCNFSRKELNRVNTMIFSQQNIAKVPQVNLLHFIYLAGAAQVCRHLVFRLPSSASHGSPHQPGSHLLLHIISPAKGTQSISKPPKSTTHSAEEEGWVDSLVSSCTYTISASTLSRGSEVPFIFFIYFYKTSRNADSLKPRYPAPPS